MTNLCPFISELEWQAQAKKTPTACRELVGSWPNEDYLDDLYDRIGGSVDLWIGHSAIRGTEWVWPGFSAFVKRHGVKDWLLTPNISPRAHLYLDGSFRVRTNPFFSLFGPEKNASQ
jgi:hypothetical protein